MQSQAGVVGNLVQKSQFTLFCDLVPSLTPPPLDLGTLRLFTFDWPRIPAPPPNANINLGRSSHRTYVETNICIPRGYHLVCPSNPQFTLCSHTNVAFLSRLCTVHLAVFIRSQQNAKQSNELRKLRKP